MIGNDIVDLACAARESNWQRRGWLQKLFTTAEQEYIHAAEIPAHIVWLLWSMKESAYKMAHRKDGISRFAPLQLVCTDVQLQPGTARGCVITASDYHYTSSRITPDFVHTLALEQNNSGSATVYISDSMEAATIPGYVVRKNDKGVPGLQHILTGNIRPVSISHHGRFAAIAYLD
ncbi:4'-phosphopantetheinyl transferase family protein [Taibaiella koreensis]|uniref:4'-phosphopantetheinyl transferase family protein n=1 Tax=Taibaiella koreensis TaxID=1268548 RepID=UPI000E59E4EB|nr:4'-phosphopantetheinyl transferase superfamily protein [Taibaiella koreensis]